MLVRQVNDEIRRLNERFGVKTETIDVLCECTAACCTERVALALPEWKAARREDRYVVVPEHYDPSRDEVVERAGAIWFVRSTP